MILENCNEKCGYAAAFLAAVCLGSFGVPVKSEVVSRLDVDPLVMQTYKTATCFLTCWLIIPLGGEPFRFTPWGIVSGLFWVPGGWAGIYAIKTAGLAVAKGTWSSVIVLTSFAWGIFIFEEHVKTKSGACCACATLIIGLIGMSWFSRPSSSQPKRKSPDKIVLVGASGEEDTDHELQRIPTMSSQDLNGTTIVSETKKRVKIRRLGKEGKSVHNYENEATLSSPSLIPLEMESLLHGKSDTTSIVATTIKSSAKKNRNISLFNGQIILTQRQAGILASLFNGLWGGTNMIPLHFAAMSGYGGPSYVISFACGAALINMTLWILRYLFELYRLDGAVGKAYYALPSFHVREMWYLGGLSGLLWSMGNFASIISVTFLGQGLGYSFSQLSMLISGLWGIFVFKEIIGRQRILMWLASASVAVAGILWLSYEHA